MILHSLNENHEYSNVIRITNLTNKLNIVKIDVIKHDFGVLDVCASSSNTTQQAADIRYVVENMVQGKPSFLHFAQGRTRNMA